MHSLPILGLGTEEIEVSAHSPLVGRRLSEIGEAAPGVHVVGLRRDQRLQRWHDVDGEIRAGDVLVALGTPDFLRALARES
jgi:uncharacterized protein with PhoU and TrkA domain